jgi:hypothetical protein
MLNSETWAGKRKKKKEEEEEMQPCEARTSCEIRTPHLVPNDCFRSNSHHEIRTPVKQGHFFLTPRVSLFHRFHCGKLLLLYLRGRGEGTGNIVIRPSGQKIAVGGVAMVTAVSVAVTRVTPQVYAAIFFFHQPYKQHSCTAHIQDHNEFQSV